MCPTLCDPMDCSLPGSSVHGIFQARVLEWVAISVSRGSSWPRDWTQVSHVACRRFTGRATIPSLSWSVVNLQCCISFRIKVFQLYMYVYMYVCVYTYIYVCIYIYILFQILFHYRLLQDIEYSSLYFLWHSGFESQDVSEGHDHLWPGGPGLRGLLTYLALEKPPEFIH